MEDVIEILEACLGSAKRHYTHNGQISFDCPNCDMGRGKGNLEVNYHKNVYSCWSCRDTAGGVKGKDIRWLIWKYGTSSLFREYSILNPSMDYDIDKGFDIVDYPQGFKNFTLVNKNIKGYNVALEYLLGRGLDRETIEKYNFGFTTEGKFKNRIIIPSYDRYGALDYFLGRDYTDKSKIKYLNHTNSKQDIIFNEHFINWDASVYLVEGVFDHVVLENSIPLLGKSISKKLTSRIQNKLLGNLYIVLDGDAKESAEHLANHMNFGNVRDKIFIIDLPADEDLSSLRTKVNINDFYKALLTGVRRL